MANSTSQTLWRNWARNQKCVPSEMAYPSSEHELAALVRRSGERGENLKLVGAGHSFTDIACTDGVMVSLDRLTGLQEVDHDAHTAKVRAGTRIIETADLLADVGLGFSSLGDIGYQSLGGALATATHGTGRDYGNIPSQLVSLEIMDSSGEIIEASETENREIFKAAQVSLGALGILTSVTIQAEPAFNMVTLEDVVPWDEILDCYDQVIAENEHFEFFWFPHTDAVISLTHNRTTDQPRPTNIRREIKKWWYTVVRGNYAFDLVCRIGRAAPSRIPQINRWLLEQNSPSRRVSRGDQAFMNERRVRFYEMEYAIPREETVSVLKQIREAIDSSGLLIDFPVEVRFVPSDDIWLSPSFGRETTYIAIHVYQGMSYDRYFRMVEEIMNSVDGRPHWGKLHFQTAATLSPRYPHWDDYQEVRRRLDPGGILENDYSRRVLGPADDAILSS